MSGVESGRGRKMRNLVPKGLVRASGCRRIIVGEPISNQVRRAPIPCFKVSILSSLGPWKVSSAYLGPLELADNRL
jgi:hypothetical protein